MNSHNLPDAHIQTTKQKTKQNIKQNTKIAKHRMSGLALLELLIAIGILGIIAAGVATLASRTFAEKDIVQVGRSVTDITLGVQRSFNRAATYPIGQEGTMIQTLVDNGIFDQETAINPINGDNYRFATASRGATANKGFVIVISGLDSSQCRQIATGTLLSESKYLAVAEDVTPVADNAHNLEAPNDGNIILKSVTNGIHINAESAATWNEFCRGDGSVNQVIVGNW